MGIMFFFNHRLFFAETGFNFIAWISTSTSNSSPGSCAYSKLARCAMAWRRRRSTGKKGREGLFFNHHQLGLATKEVTRLAATAHHARRTPPHAARRGEARRGARLKRWCGVVYWVVAFHLATHNSRTAYYVLYSSPLWSLHPLVYTSYSLCVPQPSILVYVSSSCTQHKVYEIGGWDSNLIFFCRRRRARGLGVSSVPLQVCFH